MNQVLQINTLYDYIDLLKTRTAMFIGDNKLSTLYAHLQGYQMACELKAIDENLVPQFHLFNNFVADYYLYGESTAGWKNIILADHFGNEENALKTFFQLFDQFRKQPKATNSKAILFKLLGKLAGNEIALTFSEGQHTQTITNSLQELPTQLAKVRYRFEYDEILDHLKALAENNTEFKELLVEITTQTD